MDQVYLSFKICNELFAISVLKVLEVLQKQPVTKVPNAPGYIMGIINFRGEVVPVFDTRIRFNREPRAENDPFVIIVLDINSNDESSMRIGAVVDGVRDVITFTETDIKNLPQMDTKFDSSFISSIVQHQEQFILLLNIDRMFSNNEVDIIAEVTQSAT